MCIEFSYTNRYFREKYTLICMYKKKNENLIILREKLN